MTIDVNRLDISLEFGTDGAPTCAFVVPDDAQPSDLFVVFAIAACDGVITSPFTGHAPIVISGAGGTWTEVANGSAQYTAAAGGAGIYSKVFWAKALTPGGTVTLDTDGIQTAIWSINVARISGSATAPIDAFSAYAIGADADPSVVTAASISPSVDDVLLLYCIGEAFTDVTSFKTCQPTGWQQAMYMASTITAFPVTSLIAIKGADTGPTGPAASQPITKDPVEARFNPQPLAIMIAIARGGSITGTCPFVTTDGIASEG
jgi:hypothetical protein